MQFPQNTNKIFLLEGASVVKVHAGIRKEVAKNFLQNNKW